MILTNPINRVDIGAYYSGAAFVGYMDRLVLSNGQCCSILILARDISHEYNRFNN